MSSKFGFVGFPSNEIESLVKTGALSEINLKKGQVVTTTEDLMTAIKGPAFVIGAIINVDRLSDSEKNLINENAKAIGFPVGLYGEKSNIDRLSPELLSVSKNLGKFAISDLEGSTKIFRQSLFPSYVRTITKESIKFILPKVFPDMSADFNEVEKDSGQYNILVNCENHGAGIFSAISISVDSAALKNLNDTYRGIDQVILLDYGKELANQIFGAINFNLNQIDIYSRVALPVALVGSPGSGWRITSRHFRPSIRLELANKVMSFQVEFMAKTTNDIWNQLNSSKLTFNAPEESIEIF